MTERGKLSLGRTQDQSTGGEGVSYKTFNTPVNKSVAAELDKISDGKRELNLSARGSLVDDSAASEAIKWIDEHKYDLNYLMTMSDEELDNLKKRATVG